MKGSLWIRITAIILIRIKQKLELVRRDILIRPRHFEISNSDEEDADDSEDDGGGWKIAGDLLIQEEALVLEVLDKI